MDFNKLLNTLYNNWYVNWFIRFLLTIIQLWISTWAVIWLSIFLYLIFYNIYVPSVLLTKDVFVQYDSTCDIRLSPNMCKNPFAKVSLTDDNIPLMRGQMYRFSVDLNLPESEVNWSQGMFMVKLSLLDEKRNVAINVAKPTGLKYKSPALRAICLLWSWPLYVIGWYSEDQQISVDLTNDFIEGSQSQVGPTIEAFIEFEVRDVQIYPPTVLKITAALTGLRYYMYTWRLTSFLIGTTTFCFFLYISTLIGFTRWYQNLEVDQQNQDNNHINDQFVREDIGEDIREDIIQQNNQEIEDIVNHENQRIEEIDLLFEQELNEELNEQLAEENLFGDQMVDDLNESGLTGDLSANESEASSTVVIPEHEDMNDSQQFPDISSTET